MLFVETRRFLFKKELLKNLKLDLTTIWLILEILHCISISTSRWVPSDIKFLCVFFLYFNYFNKYKCECKSVCCFNAFGTQTVVMKFCTLVRGIESDIGYLSSMEKKVLFSKKRNLIFRRLSGSKFLKYWMVTFVWDVSNDMQWVQACSI